MPICRFSGDNKAFQAARLIEHANISKIFSSRFRKAFKNLQKYVIKFYRLSNKNVENLNFLF